MKKIFDKRITHIIPVDNGYYVVTLGEDSKVYFVSDDYKISLIESCSKPSYVYPFDKGNIFIPSLYYRACRHSESEIKKYKTKADIIEGIKNAICYENAAYYYTGPSNADAKVWKLDFDTGVNEEIQLGIPKRRARQLRYAYIGFFEGKLCVMYYYFGPRDICFDDMYIRMYKKMEDEFVLISENLIERDVREIDCKYSEERQKHTFIFRKMVWEENWIRVKGEYLATLESGMKVKKIFDIREHIDNGVVSFAISYKDRFVVILWRNKLCVYDMDTGEVICDLTDKFYGDNEMGRFFDVYLRGNKLLVAGEIGMWELEREEYITR